ncbi:MAG TPA: response regulator [Gemmatimonadales bacterium]|jgi:CheY-like chemotaxis protein
MRFEALPRPIEILLVEDNAGDVRLTRELFKECKVRNTLAAVGNGVDALRYLRQEGDFAGVTRPDLVLLDLNLPRMNGQEVLAAMKGDEALRRIPVVILTTSKAEEDIVRSYNLHANCYITKPVGLDQFMTVVQSIEQFWLAIVTLPPDRRR